MHNCPTIERVLTCLWLPHNNSINKIATNKHNPYVLGTLKLKIKLGVPTYPVKFFYNLHKILNRNNNNEHYRIRVYTYYTDNVHSFKKKKFTTRFVSFTSIFVALSIICLHIFNNFYSSHISSLCS